MMLGDHRGMSQDARYFGFIASEELYAKARYVYYRRGEGLEWRRL